MSQSLSNICKLINRIFKKNDERTLYRCFGKFGPVQRKTRKTLLCFSLTHYLMVSTSVEGGQQAAGKESVWAH